MAFKYTPLPDASQYVRLLQIQPGNGEQIDCRLQVCKLAECPSYHAISYAWGDVQSTETIWIDNTALQVGHNCRYALWQARNYRHDVFY